MKEEIISLVLTIKKDGSFVSIQDIEKKKTIAEAVQRSSNKVPRLLIDNCNYVLGVYDNENKNFKEKTIKYGEPKAIEIIKQETKKKHEEYLKRLDELRDIEELKPVFEFYESNKKNGIDILRQEYFLSKIGKKERGGNIAFLVFGNDKYTHEYSSVYKRIINIHDSKQQTLLSENKITCAVCGTNKFPAGDFLHFPIKGVSGDKEPPNGRKLISYNGEHNPFESYGMIGNENCRVCVNCAKTYVEGLNSLLSDGTMIKNKKNKEGVAYKYRWPRTSFASHMVDTTMVFWTKNNKDLPEIDQLEAPDSTDVARLIESIGSGSEKESRYIEPDQFYSCTLSGAAARIAVRDWIETSLFDFKKSIATWFQDIAISEYDWNLKELVTSYAGLYNLAKSCQNSSEDKNTTLSRIAVYLWNAALKNSVPPLWILTKTLQRARLDKTGVTPERAALIKLILNRHNKGGDFVIKEKIDEGNRPVAYVCGQIFAKLESVQYAALGDRNAGIRERYFTYAMTSPAAAFGRLFNLNSKHFTKLKSEKPGLAVNLDKELQELCGEVDISRFPAIFSLEEQGQFAIGYYHQKQKQFNSQKQNREK